MNVVRKKTYYIGIDGGKHCGFAVWNKQTRKFEALKTFLFWDCIMALGLYLKKYLAEKSEVIIIIEDVTQISATFSKHKEGITNQAELDKISQHVGNVKRDTQLIMEYCERNKLKMYKVVPSAKTYTKLTQEKFNYLSGWAGKAVSQHARDAGMLIISKIYNGYYKQGLLNH